MQVKKKNKKKKSPDYLGISHRVSKNLGRQVNRGTVAKVMNGWITSAEISEAIESAIEQMKAMA